MQVPFYFTGWCVGGAELPETPLSFALIISGSSIDFKEQKLKLYLGKTQVEEFDYTLR